MEKFSIITTNDKGDVVLGRLVVKDKDRLRKVRDLLMQHAKANYVVKKDYRFKLTSNISKFSKENFTLVKIYHRKFLPAGLLELKRKIYTSTNLNTILLLTSLLEEDLDFNYYQKLPRLFVKYGIYTYEDLDKIWYPCITNMLKEAKDGNTQDLELFQACIKDGLIKYEIVNTYTVKESQVLNLDVKLEHVKNNSEALGIKIRKR